MIYAYFDWNVLDKIEKKDNLEAEQRDTFSQIEQLIIDKKIVSPYSNAHINDLLRGYRNNPTYIPKHLETLNRLTQNLCIVQYWGNNQTTWHYRDVNEFFNSALDEKDITSKPFTELFDFNATTSELWKVQLDILKATQLPNNFKEIYKASPIFSFMFPRTKTDMNFLAMFEDLYDFSNNVKKDYSLYKSFRTYVNQTYARLKSHQKMLKEINKSTNNEIPTYLNIDETWEKYEQKTKTSDNPAYQKITDTYIKIDLKGYKSDERFVNMIDDSLHVFYGAHCDYFVTIDDKCHYKAAETYHKLGIATKALKPKEFINLIGH